MFKTRLAMLGTGASGKTCYIATMHAIMSSTGYQGITCTCDYDQDRKLNLYYDDMISGKWPSNTTAGETLQFDYQYGFQTLMQFDWWDYRGGAISENPKEGDTLELLKWLRNADNIILTIPADIVVKSSNNDRAVIKTAEINSMNRLLAQLRKEWTVDKRNLPTVTVLVTKADYLPTIPEYSGLEGQERAIRRLARLFQALFVQQSGWTAAIALVSLGEHLAGHEKDPGRPPIAPVNIHLPPTFALVDTMDRRLRAITDETAALRADIERQSQTRESASAQLANLPSPPQANWFQRNMSGWFPPPDTSAHDAEAARLRNSRSAAEDAARRALEKCGMTEQEALGLTEKMKLIQRSLPADMVICINGRFLPPWDHLANFLEVE